MDIPPDTRAILKYGIYPILYGGTLHMAYDLKKTANSPQAYEICALLNKKTEFPTQIAKDLEYNPGTVTNILRELVRARFVKKEEEKKKIRGRNHQFYELMIDGIIDYWLDQQIDAQLGSVIREAIHGYSKEDLKPAEIHELYGKPIPDDVSPDLVKKLLRAREDWEKEADFDVGYDAGIRLLAVKTGARDFGLRDLLKQYIGAYFERNRESSINKMLFEDLEPAVLSVTSILESEVGCDLPESTQLLLSVVLHNQHYSSNGYEPMAQAIIQNSDGGVTEFAMRFADAALEDGEISEDEYDEVNEIRQEESD